MSLSPWPDGTDQPVLNYAISVLKDAISPGSGNEYIRRLGSTCSAIIEKYASEAPEAVREESLIRLAGYLHETGERGNYGALRDKSIDADPVKIGKTFNPAPGAFRRSGAMSLLSPWRERTGVSV